MIIVIISFLAHTMPDVGLLVCLKSKDCDNKLKVELHELEKIDKAHLSVFQFYDKIIGR